MNEECDRGVLFFKSGEVTTDANGQIRIASRNAMKDIGGGLYSTHSMALQDLVDTPHSIAYSEVSTL